MEHVCWRGRCVIYDKVLKLPDIYIYIYIYCVRVCVCLCVEACEILFKTFELFVLTENCGQVS